MAKILIGALMYYALGKLGLLMTIPPGHATIFWPPAGLALAGILFYGNKIAPAVFLGAICTTLSHGQITVDAMLLAMGVASGATLQAIAGGYFVRHFLSPPFTLEQLKEILTIFFFGGVVAGAISTTTGNIFLYLFNIISAGDIAKSWLSWYVGDVIGVFLFFPFILLLLAPLKDISLRRKALTCGSLIGMLLLTGILFFYVQEWDGQDDKKQFEAKATEVSKALKTEVRYYLEALDLIDDFFATSPKVTYEDFETFTARFFRQHPNIQAISWNKKVLHQEREQFIRSIKAQGFPDFTITNRFSGNRVLGAPKQPVYFPVTYTIPYERNKRAHGFDTYSVDPKSGNKRKRTLDTARLTGKATSTGRISIVQSKDPYSLLIYHPIYLNNSLEGKQKGKMENLRGYAAMVLHIKSMIRKAAVQASAHGMHLILTDRSAPKERKLLYDSRTPNGKESPITLDINPKALQYHSFFAFGQHGLEITLIQKDSFIGKGIHLLLWITLLSGLLFTGLLSVFLLVISGRTEMFQRLVAEKAAELQETGNILEQSLNEIYIFDAESLSFLHANQSAQENLGYNLEELRKMTPLDLKPEYTKEEFLEFVSPLRDDTEKKITFQTKHLRKDNTEYDVEAYLQCTVYKGREIFLAVIMDITEKAEVERELRLHQHDMSVIFENVPVCIWYKDDTNTIMRLNQPAAKAMGGTIKEFEGKSVFDLSPETAQASYDADLEVIKSGKPRLGMVEKYTSEEGEVSWQITDKVPYDDPKSGKRGVLVVAQDITELKNTEEYLEEAVDKLTVSNEELERFAYIASHDLQEPLRMVRNFTELLEARYGDELDNTAKSYIAIASNSAKHMQELVDDLLDYARVEQESDKLELLDPQQTLDYVKTSLHDRIMETNAFISSDPFPTISVNPVSFSCLLQNFIGNALKYTESGKIPKIHVGVNEKEREWVFSVNDNGIGMKPEYLEQIFQPFKRLHTREEYSGTGMGLAICRKTIENLGGRIWVESEPGLGSTFYFTIPKQEWEIEEDDSNTE